MVAAMAEHIRDERVQEQACGALRNLAVNADNKARIAKEGGIELVVAAMLALPKAIRVQEQACATSATSATSATCLFKSTCPISHRKKHPEHA